MSEALRSTGDDEASRRRVPRADAVRRAFESAWRAGDRPRIEDALVEMSDSERGRLFRELLRVELEQRRLVGERPSVDEYAARFPGSADVVAEVLTNGAEETRDVPDVPSTATAVPVDPEATVLQPVSAVGPSAADRRFGDYELLEEIAHGGMGVVYKARQTSLNRTVALKMILSGQLADAEEIRRFRIEAEAAAQLRHPRIVPIHEVGEIDGRHFFSMDFIEGRSLAAVARASRPAPKQATEYVRRIAEAIQFAHDRGILHRDLKPANVLVDFENEVHVTDFGLAKRADDEEHTATGQILGTPGYMPPEQAEGRHAEVTVRSDVYSLGAILYELLTGRPPFRGKSPMDTLLQVLEREVVAPRTLDPAIPKDLETICLKCLQKPAEKRYGSAGELAEELGRLLRGEPILARPVRGFERAAMWMRRHKAVSALGGLAACLLLVGLAASWLLTAWAMNEKSRADVESRTAKTSAEIARRNERLAQEERDRADVQTAVARRNEQRAEEQRIRADAQAAIAEGNAAAALRNERRANEQRDRAERLAYATRLSLAQSAFDDGDGILAHRHLQECQWNHRGWEHRHLRARFDSRQTLAGHAGPVRSVDWSPDGTRLLTGSDDRTAKVWDAVTGREILTLAGHAGPVLCANWSPDGARIATGGEDAAAKVWNAVDGREILKLEGHSGGVRSVSWSPDGARLLTGSRDRTAGVWDSATGDRIRSVGGHRRDVASVSWSPDGTRFVTGDDESALKVWDAVTGREIRSLFVSSTRASVHSLGWSPDGSRVAGAALMTATVWDAVTGRKELSFSAHGSLAAVGGASWSPDGARLATVGTDGKAKVWDAFTGQEILTLAGHVAGATGVCWSPDGTRLLTGSRDRTAKVWDAVRGQRILDLKGQDEAVWSVGWSPDGTRCLTGGDDGKANVWDVATGRTLHSLGGHSGPVVAASWSPFGNRILAGARRTKLWDADTGREILSLEQDDEFSGVTCACWSPDGARFATGHRDRRAIVWDADTGRRVFALAGHASAVSGVSWSPDGARLLTGSDDRTAKVWDALAGRESSTLEGHAGAVDGVDWSPDGTRVLTASKDGTAKVWDAVTAKPLLSLEGHTDAVHAAAWSPDGTRLLTGSEDSTVRLWDAETGQEVFALKVPAGPVWSVRWSRDGARILAGSGIPEERGNPTATVWEAVSRPEVLSLGGHTPPVDCAGWNADGTKAFAWDGRGKVLAWEVATGRRLPADDAPDRPAPGRAVSPDGRFALEPTDVAVRIVDLHRPAPSRTPWPWPAPALRRIHHGEEAARHEKAQHWFATAFHLRRMLTDVPDDADLQKRLAAAEARSRERPKSD